MVAVAASAADASRQTRTATASARSGAPRPRAAGDDAIGRLAGVVDTEGLDNEWLAIGRRDDHAGDVEGAGMPLGLNQRDVSLDAVRLDLGRQETHAGVLTFDLDGLKPHLEGVRIDRG